VVICRGEERVVQWLPGASTSRRLPQADSRTRTWAIQQRWDHLGVHEPPEGDLSEWHRWHQ